MKTEKEKKLDAIKKLDERLEKYRLELEAMPTRARRIRINLNYDTLLSDKRRLEKDLEGLHRPDRFYTLENVRATDEDIMRLRAREIEILRHSKDIKRQRIKSR